MTEVNTGTFKFKVGQYNYEYKNSNRDLTSTDQIIDNIITAIEVTSNNSYEMIQAIYDYAITTYSYHKWTSSDTDFPHIINERAATAYAPKH